MAQGVHCILLCRHLSPLSPCSVFFSSSVFLLLYHLPLLPSLFLAVYSSAFSFLSFLPPPLPPVLLFLPPSSPLLSSFSQEWGRSTGSPGAWSPSTHARGQTPFQQHLQTKLPGFNSVFTRPHPYLHGLSDSVSWKRAFNTFAYEMFKPQLIGLNE